MPWIALVCDISGVCSVVGTFEITSKPTKAARTRIVISVNRVIYFAALSFLISPPCGDAGGGDDVVLEVDVDARPPR